jgi:hypothetical protein
MPASGVDEVLPGERAVARKARWASVRGHER